MNRVGGISIAIVIIGAIIGVAYYMSSSNTSEDNLPTVEDINLDELISVEDINLDELISVEKEPEQTGKEFSVELTETIGLRTP